MCIRDRSLSVCLSVSLSFSVPSFSPFFCYQAYLKLVRTWPQPPVFCALVLPSTGLHRIKFKVPVLLSSRSCPGSEKQHGTDGKVGGGNVGHAYEISDLSLCYGHFSYTTPGHWGQSDIQTSSAFYLEKTLIFACSILALTTQTHKTVKH